MYIYIYTVQKFSKTHMTGEKGIYLLSVSELKKRVVTRKKRI